MEEMPMEFTYDNAVKWFDAYFKAFNKNAGPIETVPNMLKYFAPDFEFWPYNMPASAGRPLNREGLCMTMVHPGLHEDLNPRGYIVDTRRMAVVVQFEIKFTDERTGTSWPEKQASAHYYLAPDKELGFIIKKIEYWTEVSPPGDNTPAMREKWALYKNEALTNLAINYIKIEGKGK
jgi:hypothetical protein